MNPGLLLKAWRESWPMTLFIGLAIALAEAVIVYILWNLEDQLSSLLAHLPLVQRLVQTLLGASMADQLQPEALRAIAWVHPLVLTLVGAHAVTFGTRTPVGEVDRGTVDVVLALPISRWQLYRAEAAVWLVSGAAMLLFVAAGNLAGQCLLAGKPLPDLYRIAAVIANGFCLYVWVGGLTSLVSSLSNHRAKAIAVVSALVLASFLWDYVVQFRHMAERFSFLGLLHFYRPLEILSSGIWPIRNMLILATAGTVCWATGGMLFARRDLATV